MFEEMSCEQLRALLADYNAAWHRMNLGGNVTSVRYGEKQITYSDKRSVERGLDAVKTALAARCGYAYGTRRIIRMMPQ